MNTENNILLAEFMKVIFDDDANQYYDSIVGVTIGYKLRYDTDWNWLMEVIKQITSLEEFHNEYEFNTLFWDEFNQMDINSIYSQCVQFIEWYNEQNN